MVVAIPNVTNAYTLWVMTIPFGNLDANTKIPMRPKRETTAKKAYTKKNA
jgi:hypothetical protein